MPRPDDSILHPPGVPESVQIKMEPHAPYPDPTLGVEKRQEAGETAGRGTVASTPVNRLVTIGDSLTHGFQSGAIYNTRLSWPRIVAWELGDDTSFRFPTYDAFGGLPLNLEYIIRDLEQHYGASLNILELPLAGFRVSHLLSQIEDYWERGPGSAPPRSAQIMHNLAVYGWDLRDALSHTWGSLSSIVAAKQPRNDWLWKQVVEKANERAALRVYPAPNEARPNDPTVFEAAAELGTQGGVRPDGAPDPACEGIETLVVALGANNCLGSVVSLSPEWSKQGFASLAGKSSYNVWDPDHFDGEFAEVVKQVESINARYVIVGNVPHVTIAPIARGVGDKIRPDSRYFPNYTRPWITNEQFNQHDDPNISSEIARAIDSAIDQYNDSIAKRVLEARSAGRDWYLLDVCGVLDRLAARRYYDSPAARPSWWSPYELPPVIRALQPPITSRFFTAGPEGRTAGGLFSLDGIHPTTIGYGIFAQEVINVMQLAGVTFKYGNGVRRAGPIQVDFDRLLGLDTLVASPPQSLAADLRFVGWVDQTFDFFRGMFRTS